MPDSRYPMVPQARQGNPDGDALVEYLLAIREVERLALARELHDDVGGALVSAVMDLGFAEQQLQSGGDVREVAVVMARARASLRGAIDLKRGMTERLRPSLLDNFGLFAAFRWHVKMTCAQAQATCVEAYPDEELRLTPSALTGLFRILQELLHLALSEMSPRMNSRLSIEVRVAVQDGELCICLSNHSADMRVLNVAKLGVVQLQAVFHRVRALRGNFHIKYGDAEVSFEIHAPLSEILVAA